MVAKGYSQKFGIDYVKTFTPTAKINIVRILLALGVHFNWTLQQVDVKNAFLRGDLEELMYMDLHVSLTRVLETTKYANWKGTLLLETVS